MQIDRASTVISLEARLACPSGEAEVDMALDTGSTYVMIPWNIAQKLGYDPAVSRERVRLVTASTTEVAPLITLEYMEVLGIRIPGVKASCHDLPSTSRVQGLLGLSYLRECDLSISFKQSKLELADP